MEWTDTKPGDSPVCIVGAGFQIAALKKPMPSTGDIIEKTVGYGGCQFPILSTLYENNLSPIRDLNYIWKNIEDLSLLLSSYYHKIKIDYLLLDNKITKVIEKYETNNSPPQEITWVVFGLELKKMIAYQFDSTKTGSFRESTVENLKKIISKSKKFTWISLNYDLVLEKMLVEKMCRGEDRRFNHDFGEAKYLFDSLLTCKYPDYSKTQHLLIKPHGSLNVVFETDDQNKEEIHKIYFKNENNYFKTFDWEEFGYVKNTGRINEKRPWMIGYLPDEMKDELNSKALFSDLAHDLCKWNMAYTSFSLMNATSVFILGYSMPEDDEWIRARFKNIENKDLKIYVASHEDSEKIVQSFREIGFKNAHIVNNGRID